MSSAKILIIVIFIASWSWAAGITFTFANSTVTTDGTAKYFEFDVMARASEAGTRIGDNLVYINYNTQGFGASVASNEKVEVSKGTLLQNDGPPYYNVVNIADNTPSRFAVGVEFIYGDYPEYGNEVPTEPTQLLHIKMEISDTTQKSGLSFEEALMVGQEFYSDNTTKYDPVVANDTLDTELKLNVAALEILNTGIPRKFRIYENYPNPFNPDTNIRFDLPKNVKNVQLVVYDILGQRVIILYSGSLMAGRYQCIWDGKNQYGKVVSSGTYFAILKADNYFRSIRMVLLK